MNKINFNYIDYRTSFVREYCKNNWSSDTLFVFYDNRMKENFYKKMRNNFFTKLPTLVTFDELKDKIFITNKTVLKEVKRILTLYEVIPNDIKIELEFNNYYDIIDFANDFFLFYKTLNVNTSPQVKEIFNWQEKYLEYFFRIKELFDKYSEEHNIIPNDWIEQEKFYTNQWIKKFKKIIFIDIVEFLPLYREIIKKWSDLAKIEIALQMKKGDFDEENFRLNKVEIPDLKKEIEIFYGEDEHEILFSILDIKKDREKYFDIYSPIAERNNYYRYLPSFFGKSSRNIMNDTKIFKFLDTQLTLLDNREEKLGSCYILNTFSLALENPIFKEYYGIEAKEIRTLDILLKEGYKYISLKTLDSSWCESNLDNISLDKFRRILFDLEKIIDIKNTQGMYNYLIKQVDLFQLIDLDFDANDVLEKILEIFSMMFSNEEIIQKNGFSSYFGNKIGEGILKLFIQYMKNIVIKSNRKFSQDISIIKSMDQLRHLDNKMVEANIFIDITGENIPRISSDKSIFTEKQKKSMGIITKEDKREIERYRFFQNIFCDKKSIIFAQKNEEQNIEISPFLEEIIFHHNLEIKKCKITKENTYEIMVNTLKIGDKLMDIEDTQGIEKQGKDFDNALYLGAYSLAMLQECPSKFYFFNIAKLEKIFRKDESDLNSRILGIVVHNAMENLIYNNWKKILTDNRVNIEYQEIFDELCRVFREERYKIPVHMDNYIYEIIIPQVAKNILKFFKDINIKYRNNKLKRFQSEKSNFSKKPFYQNIYDYYLTGRVDLLIESEKYNEVIDYKTGNAQKGQLDFYNILLFGNENMAKKKIINLWNGKIEEEEKIFLTKEDIIELFNEFATTPLYTKNEKKQSCKNCEYLYICWKGGKYE